MAESSGEEAYETFATAICSQNTQSGSGPLSPILKIDNSRGRHTRSPEKRTGNETVMDVGGGGETTDDEGGSWQTFISHRGRTSRNAERDRKRPRTSSTFVESPKEKGKILSTKEIDLTVIVEGVDNNIAQITPTKMAKFLHQEIGQVQVERRRKSLKIICKDAKQVAKLKNVIDFAGKTVKVTPYNPNEYRRKAVIRVNPEVQEEELLEWLKKDKVVHAKRFKKRINGELKDTRSVLLTFETKEIPSELFFAFERYKVYEYVPQVPRCYKCQRFGHLADGCHSKARCVRCGGEHAFNECQNKETPKCCRCEQNHSAAYLGCAKYKDAVKIHAITQSEKISYSTATKRFHETKNPVQTQAKQVVFREAERTSKPSQRNERSKPQNNEKVPSGQAEQVVSSGTERNSKPVQRNGRDKFNERNQNPESDRVHREKTEEKDPQITVNSVDFLAFIVFVINNLEKETSNSNRIRLVVEAAHCCLGVQTIHPEMIHARLK